MQEEVENRTVNLAISTTKLTARSIVRLGLKGIAYIKRKSQEAAMKNEKPTGKQTIQELIGQNQGVTNIDISKTDLKGFEKYARKYGVDYAITKDKSVLPPKYLVFFKARDADAMTAAFNAYSAEILAKNKRPSVLKTLHMVNGGGSYRSNGWHGMYAMSGIDGDNERIFKVDDSMSLFIEHAVAAAKQFISDRRQLNGDWKPKTE